jgi:hypothetical protein
MWKTIKEHPAVAAALSVAVGVGALIGVLAGLANIWTAMSHDTVPQFLSKKGWAMTLPTWQAALVVCGGLVILAFQFAIVREAYRQQPIVRAPHVMVFKHDMASVTGHLLSRQVESLFSGGGWEVSTHRTNLPQHASGVWLHGGTEAERASASWGLKTLGVVDTKIDGTGDNPPALQVIIGQPEPQPIDQAADDKEALKAQAATAKTERDEARKERESLRGELGIAQQRLSQSNRELAIANLKLLAGRVPKKNVIVRYVDFSDNTLADYITTMFQATAGWTATPHRDASSHLIQETENRIVFSSGDPGIIKQLWLIFASGNLVGEPVSPQEILDKQSDDPDIIVTIFPKERA